MNRLDDSLDVRNRNNLCPNTANDSVLVILDVRNVTYRQSTDYTNTTVDYSKLLSDVVGNGRCVKAVAVDGVQYDDQGKDVCKSFHNYLWNCGFSLDLVEASNNKGKQEGVDIEIALVAQRYALLGKCDVVELITGDGDFGVLVKELRSLSVRVNVTSFYRNLSYSLKDQADSVTILDDEPVIKMQPKDLGVARMCFLDQYPDEQYLIRFNKVNSKGICGIADDYHQVYMDLNSGIRPQFGDAWYCNLVKKYTANNHFYIANPIYKVEDKNGPLVDLSEPQTTIQESADDASDEESADVIETSESQEQFVPELSGFVAIGDDTIYSPRLTAARYTVYRSFNGARFEIIPDPNGNIPCIRNSIALESFDDILDCEFPVRLDCVIKDDRILLNLTQ